MNLTELVCHFSDDDDNNEFTLGDAVLFAQNKWKNRLEQAYAVTAWALSLQKDIRFDCMEQLSTEKMETSEKWWMRLFPDCIICHVRTKKW